MSLSDDFLYFSKHLKLFVLILINLSSSIIDVNAHRNQSTSELPGPEKVYVQLDNSIYTTDQTIWFKAIVVDASMHTPTTLSSVLYVELISSDEVLMDSKIIKIEKGIGTGFFQLTSNYEEGLYMIRAYTVWDKNFDNNFIYQEYIRIFSTNTSKPQEIIHDINLIEEAKDRFSIHAKLNPMIIDSSHTGKLKVDLLIDDKRDSIIIKRDRQGIYLLEYRLPDEAHYITVQLETMNGFKKSRTIALNESFLDIQFFPESGSLVHGLDSKVGVKAVDFQGKGFYLEGEILDEKDKILAPFKTNKLGMGTFKLQKADTSHQYFARIFGSSNRKIALPKVLPFGNRLVITSSKDEFQIIAESNYLKNQAVYIQVSSRGINYFEINGNLKDGKLTYSVPKLSLPEGIICFTLFDDVKYPVAERLAFNTRPDTRIGLDLTTDKAVYAPRENTKLSIQIDTAIETNVSVLTINKDQLGIIRNSRQNILTYFLLSSDLRGEIEHSRSYITDSGINQQQMEALMLTQGWRKYKYDWPTGAFQYPPEYGLTVSGSVTSVLSNKKKKKAIELTLMTFGEHMLTQTQRTDSAGKFSFTIDDEFGENLEIVLQSANKKGKNMDYQINLDANKSPQILFNHIKSIQQVDSTVNLLLQKNTERKQVMDAFRLSTDIIYLDEVVIEDLVEIPERQEVIEKYGKSDVIISGKEIQEKEKKWSYGLFSILQFNYPDIVTIYRNKSGVLQALINNEPTLYIVDNQIVTDNNYFLVPNIPPSEVRSFEIIEGAKNFYDVAQKAFPFLNPLMLPRWGNLLVIYTKSGIGIGGTRPTEGIIRTSIPVFSSKREFYVPKYENLNPEDWVKPDLRALIHWEPFLETDDKGIASTSFYNADVEGDMIIIVEAINELGEIGYKELSYKVEKGAKQ